MTQGRRFAEAVAAKDRAGVRRLLAPDVDFRAMTPAAFWEASTPDEVVSILFDRWFEEHNRIVQVVAMSEGTVADTARITYSFELDCPGGPHAVEQQVWYRTADGPGSPIVHLRVACSGFRPS